MRHAGAGDEEGQIAVLRVGAAVLGDFHVAGVDDAVLPSRRQLSCRRVMELPKMWCRG